MSAMAMVSPAAADASMRAHRQFGPSGRPSASVVHRAGAPPAPRTAIVARAGSAGTVHAVEVG